MTYSGQPAQWPEVHNAPAKAGIIAAFTGFSLGRPPDKPRPMTYRVAAFYQFAALPDFRALREPLRALCASLGLKGSVLLAHEGINGPLAGSDDGIVAFVDALRHGELFGGRLNQLE